MTTANTLKFKKSQDELVAVEATSALGRLKPGNLKTV
eukprot:CAMPEP_0170457722 /NCGR_PEP_ID=MMETSP0123-20130129/4917_1 /TAXON_ID=182087 /ORGANISM="Favella ehrenbergii, Strain Fehren 1" /LENGTH=36 /DNA_ID= /DNA_START= /DNA_END= /DNA_ORIENTATION=